MRNIPVAFIRNFTFGVEDSLVSTVSLLSGIAVIGTWPKIVFTTGVILIFVESFSMAVGSFLSEYSVKEYETKSEAPMRGPITNGTIMFFSYFVAGFIPLFPYIIFSAHSAIWISITLSLLTLFLLGAANAKLSKINILKNGLRMLLVGGITILVGIAIGQLIQRFI